MNRNKVLILILGIVVVLSWIGITKKKSNLTNNLNTSSVLNPKNHLPPVIVSADKASNNTQEKISIPNEVVDKENPERVYESQIPWEELNEKWNEELKIFLISISERDGLRMFKAYTEAYARYLKEQDRIGKKYQQLNAIKPLSEKQHSQLGAESSKVSKRMNEVNKKIFGQHYSAVKKFHSEFEESIQVYSRDAPIGLDVSFDE